MDKMRIKVETSILETRADAAEQKIQEVRNRFDRIGEKVANSRNYWEGEANDAHRREFQEYRDDIEEALSRFGENVTDLRKIAGVYKEAKTATEQLGRDLPTDVIV